MMSVSALAPRRPPPASRSRYPGDVGGGGPGRLPRHSIAGVFGAGGGAGVAAGPGRRRDGGARLAGFSTRGRGGHVATRGEVGGCVCSPAVRDTAARARGHRALRARRHGGAGAADAEEGSGPPRPCRLGARGGICGGGSEEVCQAARPRADWQRASCLFRERGEFCARVRAWRVVFSGRDIS